MEMPRQLALINSSAKTLITSLSRIMNLKRREFVSNMAQCVKPLTRTHEISLLVPRSAGEVT